VGCAGETAITKSLCGAMPAGRAEAADLPVLTSPRRGGLSKHKDGHIVKGQRPSKASREPEAANQKRQSAPQANFGCPMLSIGFYDQRPPAAVMLTAFVFVRECQPGAPKTGFSRQGNRADLGDVMSPKPGFIGKLMMLVANTALAPLFGPRLRTPQALICSGGILFFLQTGEPVAVENVLKA